MKYIAGQYITLIVRINGRKYARPYSFSSAPSVDAALEVTVKRVLGGIVSNYIHDEFKVGDVIEVLEPIGDFTFDGLSSNHHGVFLWGVGSGITPLFSILKEALYRHPGMSVQMIYGNKTKDSSIFERQLNYLSKEYHSVFSMINFYSKDSNIDQSNTINKGRINSEFVAHLFNTNNCFNHYVHYICGPLSFKNMIVEGLTQSGLPLNSVKTEDFKSEKVCKDFANIQNQKVTLDFHGLQTTIMVTKGKSILEDALDAGLEIPHSCQTGNCDTCMGYLKCGKVKMIGLTKPRNDLSERELLLCCSYPLTEDVHIVIKN